MGKGDPMFHFPPLFLEQEKVRGMYGPTQVIKEKGITAKRQCITNASAFHIAEGVELTLDVRR